MTDMTEKKETYKYSEASFQKCSRMPKIIHQTLLKNINENMYHSCRGNLNLIKVIIFIK